MRIRLPRLFFLILVLLLAAAYVNWPPAPPVRIQMGDFRFERDLNFHLGLDLQGGLHVVLQADPPAGQQVTRDHVAAARSIIEDRVNALGVSEPVVQLEGEDRIIVELPGLKDPQQAIALFKETGELAFVDLGKGALSPVAVGEVVEGEQYRVLFTGARLRRAEVGFDERRRPQIEFELDDEGARIFKEFTRANICPEVAGATCTWLGITLDNTLISAATIRSEIENRGRITGNFTLEEARNIVIKLKYGALPVPLKVIENRTVGPTLGKDSVDKSIVAGLVGILLVAFFMLVYYRLPGLVAGLALLVMAIFKLVPVVLTLAGIAGFILSVGMAVDANILIFERMKEELRHGRTLLSAIEVGFERAWSSIRDSNVSTLITCVVLFYFGSGIVRGFAVTLFIGVLVSMFTAITVTRTLLQIVIQFRPLREHLRLYGVDEPLPSAAASATAPQ